MGDEMILSVEARKEGKWTETDVLRTLSQDCLGMICMNSPLFGFLAGVHDRGRNQRFKPKGLPKDVSRSIKKLYKEYGSALFDTPSYLTLRELKSVDWENETVKLTGMIEKKRLDKLKEQIKQGKPDWALVYPYALAATSEDWVDFELQVPVKFQFADFYEHVVKKLSSLGYADDDVRIVFWFEEDR